MHKEKIYYSDKIVVDPSDEDDDTKEFQHENMLWAIRGDIEKYDSIVQQLGRRYFIPYF